MKLLFGIVLTITAFQCSLTKTRASELRVSKIWKIAMNSGIKSTAMHDIDLREPWIAGDYRNKVVAVIQNDGSSIVFIAQAHIGRRPVEALKWSGDIYRSISNSVEVEGKNTQYIDIQVGDEAVGRSTFIVTDKGNSRRYKLSYAVNSEGISEIKWSILE